MRKRTLQESSAINRMLGTHGLPQLESGSGLMASLGFLVRDHEHLRSLLIRCEPENRVAMYDSLKPYLKFPARTLDSYVAESAQRAESQQLPTVDEEGKYKWPVDARHTGLCACKSSSGFTVDESGTMAICCDCRRPLPIGGDQTAAQGAVDQAFAKYHLEVVCIKCTKAAVFSGVKKADAISEARNAGWSYWELDGKGREICPDCPASGVSLSRAEFQLVNEFKMQSREVVAFYFGPCGFSGTKAEYDAAALKATKRWVEDSKPTVPPALN